MRRLRVADPVRCRRCGTTIERGEVAYYESPAWLHGGCLVPDVAELDADVLVGSGVPAWIGSERTAVFRSGFVRLLPPVLLALGVVVLAMAVFAPVHLGLVAVIGFPLLLAGLRSGDLCVDVTVGGDVVVHGWLRPYRCGAGEVESLTAGRIPRLSTADGHVVTLSALAFGDAADLAGYLGVDVLPPMA
ncbi:MAG: hypothetical protein K1X95_10105 [Acidimicrobiia bacterium]|nr:hypothetical protein [Acidimicrobiia bacterium]